MNHVRESSALYDKEHKVEINDSVKSSGSAT